MPITVSREALLSGLAPLPPLAAAHGGGRTWISTSFQTQSVRGVLSANGGWSGHWPNGPTSRRPSGGGPSSWTRRCRKQGWTASVTWRWSSAARHGPRSCTTPSAGSAKARGSRSVSMRSTARRTPCNRTACCGSPKARAKTPPFRRSCFAPTSWTAGTSATSGSWPRLPRRPGWMPARRRVSWVPMNWRRMSCRKTGSPAGWASPACRVHHRREIRPVRRAGAGSLLSDLRHGGTGPGDGLDHHGL